MDHYCPRCGEPVDNEEFHEVAAETGSDYAGVTANFRQHGCEALYGTRCAHVRTERTMAASAMYDLLGDDMDGAAAMMEDFGF